MIQQSKLLGLNVNEDELNSWIDINNIELVFETLSDEQFIAEVQASMNTKDEDGDYDHEEMILVSMKEAVVMLEKACTAYERCNSTHLSEIQLINFQSLIPLESKLLQKSLSR